MIRCEPERSRLPLVQSIRQLASSIFVAPTKYRFLTEREKAALEPYIPKSDLDNGRIRDGHVPWYLPARFRAITRGNRIYLRPKACRMDEPDGLALLAHELVHVGQYRRGATWLTFVVSYLRRGYWNSPLELEARRTAERVRRDLARSAD